MSFFRRYWVLILGVVVLVAGIAWFMLAPPVVSFGWTAYAPLTSTTFTPGFPGLYVIGNLVILLGAVLVAGWVGFRIGQRRQSKNSAG